MTNKLAVFSGACDYLNYRLRRFKTFDRHYMFSVKIFGRRPSSQTRQKHGGFNATFPMNFHTVIQQAAIQDAFNQAIVVRAEAIRRAGGVEAPRENNVLNFAERSNSLRRDNRNNRPTRRD